MYQAMYREKLKSIDECLAFIEEGDMITVSTNANEPSLFLENFHKVAEAGKRVRFLYGLSLGYYRFMEPEYAGKIDMTSTFLMGGGRKALASGRMEYIPSHLHSFYGRFAPMDVVVIQVTPMDEHGYFRHSLECLYEEQWCSTARVVLLEVNPNMPVVYGDNAIHISEVTAVYENDRPIAHLNPEEPGEDEKKIGQYIAELINDGDTIQWGIGQIPNAVAQSLKDKRHLGVHTEMITSSLVDLVEWGVVDGSQKTLHKKKIIGAFALGNDRLYKFMEHNPAVYMMPAYYVNDPQVIAKNDNMVSINTGMNVDFWGQINSESIGPRPYSGSGGQNDTAEGAIHAKNGRSIIALHSTAKKGTISTINPTLPVGSVVTMSANNIDYIVTEYGIAQMKFKTLKERTENLIKIAHPDFRDQLKEEAQKMKLL